MDGGPTTQAEFERIAEIVLASTSADDAIVRFRDRAETALRFSGNRLAQHVSVRGPAVTVEVAYGSRLGRSGTNRLDRDALRAATRRAEHIARLAQPDPQYLPPPGPRPYANWRTFRTATAEAGPGDLVDLVRPVLGQCAGAGLKGAGTLSTACGARGVAASTRLFAYERTTEARFSLSAAGDGGTGWVITAHRDLGALDIQSLAGRAIEQAAASLRAETLTPGVYPVILGPAAVAAILGSFLWVADARSYHRGDSPFVGLLGHVVLDTRLYVRTDPAHDDLLGARFNDDGLAAEAQDWVRRGVLKRLYYDRYTARVHGLEPTPDPDAPVMEFVGPQAASIEALTADVPQAVLLSDLRQVHVADRNNLTLEGTAGDSAWLVEEGRVVAVLRGVRFHDSPLRFLADIGGATAPMEAATADGGKMLVPALRILGLYLSNMTRP